MFHQIVSKNKADAISNGVLLICIGILFFAKTWWPWFLLAIWLWLGLRQVLTGRKYDFIVSTIVILGLFIFSFFNVEWAIVVPVLFVIGGIALIFREYVFPKDTNGEDVADEIKDDSDEV